MTIAGCTKEGRQIVHYNYFQSTSTVNVSDNGQIPLNKPGPVPDWLTRQALVIFMKCHLSEKVIFLLVMWSSCDVIFICSCEDIFL